MPVVKKPQVEIIDFTDKVDNYSTPKKKKQAEKVLDSPKMGNEMTEDAEFVKNFKL